MARSTINVRIPPYRFPSTEWRKDIHQVAYEKARELGIEYSAEDKIELWIKFYFDRVKIHFADVDNRCKDVLDALQGHVGGSGGRSLPPIIPDDSQVYRVVVEKAVTTPQSHGKGHLKIRKYAGGELKLRF